jgi:hypothetical protein
LQFRPLSLIFRRSPSPAFAADEAWVCIGHSHVGALQRAGKQEGVELDAINFWETGEYRQQEDGRFTGMKPELARRLGQGRRVFSLVGGAAHTVLGMVEQQRAFDFVLPSAPDLPIDETRELVAAEALREKLTEMAEEHLAAALPLIIQAAQAPVLQLEPPPPVADEDRIIPHIAWDMYFPGQPKRIAPKWVRYKLWRMHSEVIETVCARFNVGYIRAPEAAKDSEGFLDLQYDEDGAHANGAYGALVLQQLKQVTA